MQAQQYRMDPNEFAQAIDANKPGAVHGLPKWRVARPLAAVLDRARITDASGNVVDISELGVEEDAEDEPSLPILEVDADDPLDDTIEGEGCRGGRRTPWRRLPTRACREAAPTRPRPPTRPRLPTAACHAARPDRFWWADSLSPPERCPRHTGRHERAAARWSPPRRRAWGSAWTDARAG